MLDINQALWFLDCLDQDGRHTIASEHPTSGPDGGPKWEGGATFEPWQRQFLIEDIKERQARGSNVYYGVNRPCPITEQQGWYGKTTADDIIGIRALAFDIDFCKDVALPDEFQPSFLIATGGGLHLIYLFNEVINVNLHRPPMNDEQKQINEILISVRSNITNLGHSFETKLRRQFPSLKIDNMSNVDRVMRLPGTINYPKAEKRARGQVPALAHIVVR